MSKKVLIIGAGIARLAAVAITGCAMVVMSGCSGSAAARPVAAPNAARFEDKPIMMSGRSSSSRLEYLITMPSLSAGGARPPLIVFLHSLEERGTDVKLLLNNPAGQGLGLAGHAMANADFPFATLSPLCPRHTYWTFLHGRLARLVREIVEIYGLDSARIFLSGVSMGGIASWSLGMAEPELFRAIAPIAGPVYTPPILPRYNRLKTVPVLAFHDRLDPSIPFDLAVDSVQKLNAQGGSGQLTEYNTGRHYIQDLIFAEGKLFSWFLGLNATGHESE